MIDWPRLEALAWTAPTFTAKQKKAAAAAVRGMDSPDDNPDHVAGLWPQADDLPDISQIDFGDAYQAVWTLSGLMAGNGHDWLNRQKLLDHINDPGDSLKNPNPFTAYPIVTKTKDGDVVIVDGHHRLGALLLLGAVTWQLWTVPAS